MQYIADLIKLMIKRGDVEEKDLYKYTDKGIVEMGKGSSDIRISSGWENLSKLTKIYTRFTPVEDRYCVKLKVKQRYVDPLVRTDSGYKRVSKVYRECKDAICEFLDNDTDLYCFTDFNI